MTLLLRPTSGVARPVPRPKNYILAEKLGAGTYAAVYKAFSKVGAREAVAIKCILKSSLNAISKDNLLTEIELLKTLRHEHIVGLKDFEWDDHFVYLIMEYCAGGDLRRFVSSQRCLSERTVRRFLRQLAKALQYMREKKVSHMDLKPQNILLFSREHPVLKVADFGFAHYLLDLTDATFLRGSPLYMAPEIVCQRQYDAKADLWSVGVILYECLFGQAPFASATIEEVIAKIKDTAPVELPYNVAVSGKCRDLLDGLLQRLPERRLSFEAFFAHPFVDLEHAPSKDSLPRAIELVTAAVAADASGDLPAAVDLYCKALEHFVAAIDYETDALKQEALRKKVQEYINRAEALKDIIRSSKTCRDPGDASYHDLVTLSRSSGSTQLTAAVEAMGKLRSQCAGAGGGHDELTQYQQNLEVLIKLSQELDHGKLKELLLLMIHQWMSEAERLQEQLRLASITSETKQALLYKDSGSAKRPESASASSCIVQ